MGKKNDLTRSALEIIEKLELQFSKLYNERVCPCTIASEPCRPSCSCVEVVSSYGCKCCTQHGSEEQRKQRAEHIVHAVTAFDAERDTTPVDAEWLDEVPGLSRIATLDGWWESENKQVVVELFKETGKSLIRFRKELHGKIYEGGIGFVEPTRGDVLTCLRLFGGERK